MKLFKAILSLITTAGLVYGLGNSFGAVPALGPLLSPFSGFWVNATSGDAPSGELAITGLEKPVTVHYDDNLVPHIFAENDHDLYFAQGYVTARERLFQMDLSTRSAAGRLCEVVGEKALPLDLYKRRTGSVYAAERSLEFTKKDPLAMAIAQAYSDGVNAYIASLSPSEYPLEYKLLGFVPEAWSPLKSMLLLVEMTHTLASPREGDVGITNLLSKSGTALVNDLFPNYPFRESPIIPTGTKWDFKPVPSPKQPANYQINTPVAEPTTWIERQEGIGSNNWAISGEKSATGLPILAGDPHLSLTLPSIWYQVQLSSPTSNVSGVSLPGAPAVIIGFNKNIAWSVTNVASDVTDFYSLKFKDTTRSAYWYDGAWKPTSVRVEAIKVKGKSDVIDSVRYTHHGPIGMKRSASDKHPTLAFRWIAHEPANNIKTFYQLNRAENYDDYVAALGHYAAPAQNFVFASNQGDIAMWVNGKFPLKWKEQGKFLLDGSNPEHDWAGFIPQLHNPHVKNPARGFVSSANQFSTDPTYPYYLHHRFSPANRGIRINERLTVMQKATADSLRNLQNDNYSVLARDILPELLKNINPKDLSSTQKQALDALVSWDKNYTATSVGASVFERWTDILPHFVFRDEIPTSDDLPMALPSADRTWKMLLKEPNAVWYDDVRTTDRRETKADLVLATFKASVDSLQKYQGAYSPKTWAWGQVKATKLPHILTPLKAFASKVLDIGGGRNQVNAVTSSTGPSWRMVVALGKDGPTAYGVYPGGQSGKPGTKYFDNMTDTWAKGELYELVYLKTKDEANKKITSTFTLRPKK